MIVAKNLSVVADKKTIVAGVNLTLEPGKVHVIVGPNGAGKSTLLGCLTGSLKPSSGQVILNNKQLSDYNFRELAQQRAVLSQSISVDFYFKAYEIVMMGRNPHIVKNESVDDDQIIDEVLEKVDAKELKDRIFPTLSGGEQQRIQLARVLAQVWRQKKAALFLDEPTAALDLKHQHQLFGLLKTLATDQGWTIVIIVHDLRLAKIYGDKVILMKAGSIYDQGETADTLNHDNITKVFEIPAELAIS